MEMSEYDVIIVGTNLVQSILAAALARSGRKVLYIDDAKWYGAENSTLSFNEFEEFMQGNSKVSSLEVEAIVEGNSRLISCLSAFSLSAFEPIGTPEGTRPSHRINDFNIDLTARLIYCRGRCVDVLAESGVSRYLEFQPLDGTFFCSQAQDSLQPLLVPQSKSQVFSSSALSMVEKRQLMRFLQFCLDYRSVSTSEESVEWTNERLGAQNPGRSLTRPQNKSEDSELMEKAVQCKNDSLSSFLQKQVRMSKKLTDIVLFAIAHQTFDSQLEVTVEEGMARVGSYLGALGRFGSTPFLTPMYGSGEVCQGFSRLCAVYAGVCALGVKPSAIYEDGIALAQSQETEFTEGLPPFIKAKAALVVSGSYFSSEDALFPGYADEFEVRAVALLTGSVFDLGINRAFFVVPPSSSMIASAPAAAVHGIQLDHRARVVSDQQYMLQLSTRVQTYSQTAMMETKIYLAQVLERLVARKNGAVQVTWQAYFSRRLLLDGRTDSPSSSTTDKPLLFVTGNCSSAVSPAMDVDVDQAFITAERIFASICPGEVFLPASESELRVRQEEQNEALMTMPDLQ